MRLLHRRTGRVHSPRLLRRIAAPAIAGSILLSCTNGGPEEVLPRATISHESTVLTLQPGGAANVIFSIDRQDGHSAAVNFSVRDVPTGIVANFNPSTVSGTALVTTLSVAVGVAVQPGPYSFQARVVGNGVEEQTIPVTLTVNQSGVALNLGQSTTTVEQQKSVSIPVTIERVGGYTGAVGLTVLGLPSGVTAQFEPGTILPNQTTSELTLSASLGAEITSSSLTVRATGTGTVEQLSSLQVTVAPTTTPGVLLVPNPTLVQVRPGEAADANIEVRRFAGYQGTLDFALSAAPAGVTATFVPSATDANVMVMRVSVAPEATVGEKAITVRATGSGITAAEIQMTAQVVPHPTFVFSNSGALVTVIQGTSVTNALLTSITRIGGFAEPIRLSADGVPAGLSITPNIDGFEIPGTGVSGFFGYVVSDNAIPGPHTITVRGTSTVTNKTATGQFPIMIRAKGSYTLATNTSSITMPHGTQRLVDITITRTGGFSGNVTFSVVTTQLGWSAVFTPPTTDGNSVQLLVSIGVGMTPRTFTVFVRGTSPGADNVELPLSITVTP